MKKFLGYILLLSVFSLNNLGFVFADNDYNLQSEKINSVKLLDNIENSLNTTLDNIESKVKDSELKEQIQEKQQEIEDYIQEKQEEIKKENSSSDIKEILDETKNVITLKAIAGITANVDLVENISSQINVSKKDLEKAEDTLINSIENKDSYTLVLKTKLTSEEVLVKLKKYDENININILFPEDENNFFELNISKNSLLRQELLENADIGELPNTLLGIEIVKPELLQIGEMDFSGEQKEKLWGLEKYDTSKYLEIIKNQTNLNGKKIKVGIIDTGVTYNHPDLKGQISKTTIGYDFVNDDYDSSDDQGHGTHVAGTIAGSINGVGIYGINPNVEIVPLKICDSSGFCPTYGVLKALDYAKENKIDVLNMSLGAKGNVSTSSVCSAIKDVTSFGTIVVAASGNSNIDTSRFVPGGCSEVITVGAVDENLKRASFSNYGEKVDVSAPGVNIYSTYLNDGYKNLNGTSMATPHIVGLVSIIKTYNQNISTGEVKEIFKNNSLQVNTESTKKMGGFVDLGKIMNYLGVKEEDNNIDILQENETKKDEIIQENIEENQISKIDEKYYEQQEKTPEELGLIDESLIDENIGFFIQNEDEQTKINNAEDENNEIINGEDNVQDNQEIDLNGENKVESNETVEINNIEEIDPKEEQEESLIEDEETGIQNTYTCTILMGNICTLSLSNANTYNYTVSQSGYIGVKTSSSRLEVTGTKVGSVTLNIKNGTKTIHTVNITIKPAPKALKATLKNTSIVNGTTTSITVTDGNGGYTVTSSNTSIATISGSNTNWIISGKGVGTTTITIKDSAGKIGTWTLTVTSRNISLDKTSLVLDSGVYDYINITDGNGGYTITKSSSNLTVSISGTKITLYSKVVGNYTIQVKDSAGKVVSAKIEIKDLPKIISYTHTPTVEDGYVGGFYFKIDKPNLVKEAGIEYFHTNSTNIIPKTTDWKKQTLKVETDGEFGAFILPRSKVNYVRGYIVTQSGNKIYTSTNGNIIASNVSLSDYYNLGGGQMIANVGEDGTSEDTEENENIGESYENEYSGENEDGVEVNSVGKAITIGLFVAGVGLTVYTCENEGWTSTDCLISGGLTVVPVGKVAGFTGKFLGKNVVLNYCSSTILGKLSSSLGKYIDDIANLGKWAKLIKPIKSIDLKHIVADHTFGTIIDKSKFLKGSNIESIIKEGYSKSGRKFLETTSTDIYTGKNIKTILIEVDMGKIIGTNAKGNGSYSILRTIVDYEGNILSSFPVATYSIK